MALRVEETLQKHDIIEHKLLFPPYGSEMTLQIKLCELNAEHNELNGSGLQL